MSPIAIDTALNVYAQDDSVEVVLFIHHLRLLCIWGMDARCRVRSAVHSLAAAIRESIVLSTWSILGVGQSRANRR